MLLQDGSVLSFSYSVRKLKTSLSRLGISTGSEPELAMEISCATDDSIDQDGCHVTEPELSRSSLWGNLIGENIDM